MNFTTSVRSGAWRSRWAAVGAAVAVTLGAGGMVAVNAAASAPSSFVGDTPVRILDTRTDVGLSGPFVSGVAQTLQVTGSVPTQPPNNAPAVNAVAVPTNATSVVFNVTAVRPATAGFLSIRPGDATGTPATSNINWAAGGPNTANSVTVQLPASGTINIFVSGTVGEVLIDVAGYYIPGGADLTDRVVALENKEITGEDIIDETVDGNDVKDGTIGSSEILDGSLTGVDIADESIDGNDVKDGTIGSSEILDGSLTGVDITDESIDGNDVKDGTIGSSEILDGSLGRVDLDADVRPRFIRAEASSGGVTVLASSGLSGVLAPVRFSTGVYGVAFDRDVTDCAWNATVFDNGGGVAAGYDIMITQNAGPTGLDVRILDTTGTAVDLTGNDGFSVVVTC